jgi:hypothetical protein
LKEALDAGEDVIGALGPDEGLGVLTGCYDTAPNNLLQRTGAAELPAPELAGAQ